MCVFFLRGVKVGEHLYSAGKGPFPGIVDLYTFGGRLSEPRASILAGKGYVVLALAYFGYEDLPKNPEVLDLEYFEEAVSYLRRQPEVSVGHYVTIIVGFLFFCFLLQLSRFKCNGNYTSHHVLE